MRHFYASFVLAIFIFPAVPTFADAVTTSDNLTLFGHIEKMDATEVLLEARFPSKKGVETKSMPIPRAQVVRIEFNATTFNPGAPPGLRPEGPTKSTAPPSRAEDTVVLRGGEPQACPGATIDAEGVQCGKKKLGRDTVVRILLRRER